MIKIQANINGFAGKPATVLGALDERTGILVIAKSIAAIPRYEDCLVISSDARGDRDATFTHAHMHDAITAYFRLRGETASDGKAAKLRFSELAAMADPSSVIENDGVDTSGPRYRIAPDASNAHIAALAICRYAVQSDSIDDVIGMLGELSALLRGEVLSV
ncbi:MAG: hypothetical protein ACRDBT_05480 [Aeromonas sp.]